jgi:hypothetical protein
MTTIEEDFSAPAAPGSGDKLPLADLLGSLLLFTVDKVNVGIVTEFGETDAVGCAVAALDGPNKGTVYADTLIFPRVLQSQLRHAVGGGKVLGRLAQGLKKPGKNAPWILEDPTEDDIAIGKKYLAHVAEQAKASAPF